MKKLKSILMENKVRNLIGACVLIAIFYQITFISPKIQISVQIQSVTDTDYDIFVKNSDIPIEKKTRDNCRYISVVVKTARPLFLLQDVKIKNDTLKGFLEHTQYFNKSSKDLVFLGQYTGGGENEYGEGIDVYMDGMTDEKLKDFFEDFRIEVTWVNLLTGKNKQVFYLKDYFE